MSFIKKYFWEWLVVDTVKGLVKGKLNGNKTSLGLLGVIAGVVSYFFPELPVTEIIETLPVEASPVSVQDLIVVVGSLQTVWGLIHKVIKAFKGQPQNPLKETGLV